MDKQTIDEILRKCHEYIDTKLMPIINLCNERVEGNIFDEGENVNIFLPKRQNIVICSQNKKNALEIGFNSGFSALLILLSNSDIKLTCVDIAIHSYTLPCFVQLKNDFGDRINLIVGDSRHTVPNITEKFDLIHIDGGHTLDIAECDIVNTNKLLNNNSIIIMDDVNINDINHSLANLWKHYVINFDYKKPTIELYNNDHHDIRVFN
jgi:spermidine synthase